MLSRRIGTVSFAIVGSPRMFERQGLPRGVDSIPIFRC